jgi:uncharacterized protein
VASEVFLDTSYAIAISSSRDEHRPRALELSRHLRSEGTQIITTRAVIIEIGNALAKAHLRGGAITLIDAMEADPHVEIIPVSEELYAEGAKLYRDRQDKEWGMTDCISFAAMRNRGVQDALTADDHFRQAGFRALLTEQ